VCLTRIVTVLTGLLVLAGCSKGKGPTSPMPAQHGFALVSTHPEAASVSINGGPFDRFTPLPLDTAVAAYSIHFHALGYADTTITLNVQVSPANDTARVTLRPLAGTPATVTSWDVPAQPYNLECMSVGPGDLIYLVSGVIHNGWIWRYSSTGALLGSVPFPHTDDYYSGIAVDGSSNSYLAPSGGGFVSKQDPSGLGIGAFGTPSPFPSGVGGVLLSPAGDSLFVAAANELAVLRPSDGMVYRITGIDHGSNGSSSGTGPFTRDPSGRFYFTPLPNDSLLITDGGGQRLGAWGVAPRITAVTRAPDGTFYAVCGPADIMALSAGKSPGRIVHLSASGVILGQRATEHVSPSGIAVASTGDVYVSDFYRGKFAGNPAGAVYRWTDLSARPATH
jgi:sugar lactone lactonase YvrE